MLANFGPQPPRHRDGGKKGFSGESDDAVKDWGDGDNERVKWVGIASPDNGCGLKRWRTAGRLSIR